MDQNKKKPENASPSPAKKANEKESAAPKKSGSASPRPNPKPQKNAQTSASSPASKKEVFFLIARTLGKYCAKIATYAINILLTVLLIGIITGSAIACALVVYIKNYVDPVFDIEDLKTDSNLTTKIYYETTLADGTKDWVEWEEERIHGTENRMWVAYEEMPEDLINAFVSIEDKRFFTHKGVDMKRTIGAILQFATGNDSYGGSTITQQLIKNVTGDDDVTIQRKIQEILRALNLESKRSKEEILENYLNTIYLSKGCYGVSAAAYEYFGKEVSELTLVECASLASIPQNPSRFDPISHPENNDERRDTVLNEMYYNTNIDKTYTIEEIRAAKKEELVLARGEEQKISTVHSWFVDTLIFDIIDDLQATYNYDEQTAKNLLYSGGLKIYATIDRNLQSKVDAIYANDANFPSHGTGVQVQSAVTVIDHSTGKIVAIHGGRGEKGPLDFNRATMAHRQPGSSIKPLSAYSVALEKGLINYSTVFDDTPFKMEPSGYVWPNNHNKLYEGLVTVSHAVRNSKNTIAVKVVDLLGTKTSYDFLKNKFRLSTLVPSDMDYAPLALGGFTEGVTNRDMTAAYAAIANNGVYNKPKTYLKVLDSADNIILDNTYSSSEVILSEDTCAVMTKLLEEVVTSGTGTAVTLRRKINVAGKTGTTSDSKDLYFCGYTPYYTAAVWVGYDKPKSLYGFTAGQRTTTASTYLWDQVMTAIHEDIIAAGNVKKFSDDLTKSLVTRSYCKDSGLLVGGNCSHDPRGGRTATGFYTRSNMPSGTCSTHVLVPYCNETGCIAGPNCTDTTSRALIDVKRTLVTNVAISDAQYTYFDMPAGVKYAASAALPYYYYAYPSGTFSGYSKVSYPYNKYCSTHNPELCQ
ncbi:MAG: PBP1A family penicillin-binding protein [Ruminococcaceae bacterium]|nr:PBP1A family penicillin-binding protein [Oscillospiraceae bacterium]